MKKYLNGEIVEMSAEEIAALEAQTKQQETEYWRTVDEGEAINTEIRKCYTESQEFSILRQKDEKPEEYAAYYAYCEECKAFVKEKKKQS